MQTPAFWYKKKSVEAKLLSPLSLLYSLGGKIKQLNTKTYKASVPVICVGNLSVGGTGKTPVSIAICEIIKSHNLKPIFLSRGYGGSLDGVLINPKEHTPAQAGDEPLLLSQHADIVVSADRAKGAKICEENGADIIIMDDGFQNFGLHKDLSIIVIDGATGFGNGKILPAGPLRESLKDGIKRSNAAIIIGEDRQGLSKKLTKPIIKAEVAPCSSCFDTKQKRIIAFAGIGRPKKFFDFLVRHGADIVTTFEFPDHHVYTEDELNQILKRAAECNATAVTTDKDAIKFPPQFADKFCVSKIEIKWENEQVITELLQPILNKHS